MGQGATIFILCLRLIGLLGLLADASEPLPPALLDPIEPLALDRQDAFGPARVGRRALSVDELVEGVPLELGDEA